LHELNSELLEQSDVAHVWILDNRFQVPNMNTFYSLLEKSKALLKEMQADEPKIQQYNFNRRKVTANSWEAETDDNETEPI
jgi:hypothetical protein